MDTAILGGHGTDAVFVDISPQLNSISIYNSQAMLHIDDSSIVTLGDGIRGGLFGPGGVLVNTSGGFATTRLQLRGNATVDSHLILNTPDGQMPGLRSQVTSLDSTPVVIGTNGVITGRGRVAGRFVNAGELVSSSITDWLQVSRAHIDQVGTGGAVRVESGGVIELLDSTVQGGTWIGDGLGILSGQRSTITDGFFDGTIAVSDNANLELAGTVTGPGTILITSDSPGSEVVVGVAPNTSIETAVELRPSVPTRFFDVALVGDGPIGCTIAETGVLSGSGVLEGRWTNNGIIEVSGPDGILSIDALVNNGPSGIIRAPEGGLLRLDGPPIQDVRWAGNEGGPAGRIEDGLINNGTFEHRWDIDGTNFAGTTNGAGQIRILARTVIDDGAVLDLDVELDSGNIDSFFGAGVLGPQAMITGTGRISNEFTNQGLIAARGGSEEILIAGGPLLNTEGRIVASDGGLIDIQQTLVTGGTFEVTNGTALIGFGTRLQDVYLQAGEGDQGATMETFELGPDLEPNTIAGGTLEGQWSLSGGDLLAIDGHLRNSAMQDGWLIVRDAGSPGREITQLRLNENASMDASIWLDSPPDAAEFKAHLERIGGGRARRGETSTLAGTGRIQGAFEVAGTVSPGGPGPAGRGASPIGELQLNNGAIEFTPTVSVSMEIAGRNPQEHDRITGPGTGEGAVISMDGQLGIRYVDGFEPSRTDRFELITGLDQASQFESYDIEPTPGPAADVGPAHIVYSSTSVLLVVCSADRDADGDLTAFDFLAFQNQFVANDPAADLDRDGRWTVFDWLLYQTRFQSGC